jgi:hypothetical protein
MREYLTKKENYNKINQNKNDKSGQDGRVSGHKEGDGEGLGESY